MFDADINSHWFVCDIPLREEHAIVAKYNVFQGSRYLTLVDSKTGDMFSIYEDINCAPITEKQAQKAIANELKFVFDNE